MTDRIKGLWVALDCNIREDEIEPLIEAIKMLRNVEAVTAKKVKSDDWMIENQLRAKIRDKLVDLFKEIG